MERTDLRLTLVHCPYCKDALGDFREVLACGPCGARHHEDCHRELGRCATCGSSEALVYLPSRFTRRRSRRAWFLAAQLVIVASTGFVTWRACAVREGALEDPILREERKALESQAKTLAREEDTLAAARSRFAEEQRLSDERYADERRSFVATRQRALSELDDERERTRFLARRGWRVAEILGRATPALPSTRPLLLEAERLLPEGPSVLREELEARLHEAAAPIDPQGPFTDPPVSSR